MARKRILLVDDSDTVLMANKLQLAQHGYEILTAKDGRAAVDIALREKPDLIFMDVLMPELDGFEAVILLRQHEATKTVPIVMLTTRGEEHNIARGREVGANDYLTKPVRAVDLFGKVRAYLGE